MEVIILAGGLGVRLRDVIQDIPKPMAPIRTKPFLSYLLDWVLKYPVTKIILAVGYKSEVIKSHFGDNFNGIPLFYAQEQEPLGTGGAILNALNYVDGPDVTIINGDTYFPIDLELFNEFHEISNGALSIALKEMVDFDRYGTVNKDGDIIIGFEEKKPLEIGLINGGIYVLSKKFLEDLNLPAKFSFEQEILEKQASTGILRALVFTETFIDIGIPEDYKKACDWL